MIIDTVETPLVVVIDLLAVAGILFALGCLTFNFVYRKTRYTHMHSYCNVMPYNITIIRMQDYANQPS